MSAYHVVLVDRAGREHDRFDTDDIDDARTRRAEYNALFAPRLRARLVTERPQPEQMAEAS